MAASKAESSAPGSKPATISKGQGDVVGKDLGHDMTQRQLHNAVGNEPQSHAGRVALVTGATSGIGLEVAGQLAGLGMRVIFGVRNANKAKKVADTIRARVPDADLMYPPEMPAVNFDDNASVTAFAAHLNSLTDLPIHVLVNNAGMAGSGFPGKPNVHGIVDIVQTNYLGPYLLTRLLEGKLVASKARIVNLSSVTHRCYTLPANPWYFFTRPRCGLYPHTKEANVLFAYELQRRLGPLGVEACAVDPGGVRTSIWEHISIPGVQTAVDMAYAPAADAAQGVVHAATVPWDVERPDGITAAHDLRFYARGMFASPLLTHVDGAWRAWIGAPMAAAYGTLMVVHSLLDWPLRYWSKGKWMSAVMLVPSAKQTYDPVLAHALWEASEVAVGLSEPPTSLLPSQLGTHKHAPAEDPQLHQCPTGSGAPPLPAPFGSPPPPIIAATSATKKRVSMSPGQPIRPTHIPFGRASSPVRTAEARQYHAVRSPLLGAKGVPTTGDLAWLDGQEAGAGDASPTGTLGTAGNMDTTTSMHMVAPPSAIRVPPPPPKLEEAARQHGLTLPGQELKDAAIAGTAVRGSGTVAADKAGKDWVHVRSPTPPGQGPTFTETVPAHVLAGPVPKRPHTEGVEGQEGGSSAARAAPKRASGGTAPGGGDGGSAPVTAAQGPAVGDARGTGHAAGSSGVKGASPAGQPAVMSSSANTAAATVAGSGGSGPGSKEAKSQGGTMAAMPVAAERAAGSVPHHPPADASGGNTTSASTSPGSSNRSSSSGGSTVSSTGPESPEGGTKTSAGAGGVQGGKAGAGAGGAAAGASGDAAGMTEQGGGGGGGGDKRKRKPSKKKK